MKSLRPLKWLLSGQFWKWNLSTWCLRSLDPILLELSEHNRTCRFKLDMFNWRNILSHVLFFFHLFQAIADGTQGSILALYSEITPQELYVVLGMEPRLAVCKTSTPTASCPITLAPINYSKVKTEQTTKDYVFKFHSWERNFIYFGG